MAGAERVAVRVVDPFEAWLAAGLAVEPSPAVLKRIDRRVRAALDAPTSLRPRRRFLGRGARGLLLLGAVLAIAGAGAGVLGLFNEIIGPVGGWRLAFERGERLGIAVTSGEVRLTLERAYADANEVVVFVTSVDLAGTADVLPDAALLTDADGRTYDVQMGSGNPDSGTVAHQVIFETPEPWLEGARSFTFTIPSLADPRPGARQVVGGPWTLRFELDTHGGRPAEPGPPVTVDGTTVELRQLVVSPSAIRGRIAVTVPFDFDSSFGPIGSIRIGSRTIPIAYSGGQAGADPLTFPFGTVEGLDDPAIEGTVTITKLVGDRDGAQVRLQGPWVISFRLP